MNSSSLKDNLSGVKSKLENFEKEFEDKLKDVEDLEEKFRKADEQLNEFISTKDSVIQLNVGGKVFQTKISTFLSIKDTLFHKLIVANLEDKKDFKQVIFFDRGYKFFPFIMEYIRTKKFSLKGFSIYDIEDLFYECEYYGLTEITVVLEEIRKEIEFIKFEGSAQYSNAGTHKLEDLKDKSLTKGICVQSPYTIIIELNFEHEISAMEIGGYNGNITIWGCSNGSNAKVSTSCDKVTWNEVGLIPSNHGSVIQKVSLKPSVAKFIKFQHNTYLGIGYLNLLK